MLLQAASGELDFHVRHFNTNANKPVLADAAESGNYRLFDTIPSGMNTAMMALNMTHKDPVLREILAKQYTEFDVELANEFLDRVVPEKNGDGIRLRPDGQKLDLIVEVAIGGVSTPVDEMNMVVRYWQEVGINARLEPEDRSLMFERKAANDHDCVVWGGDSGLRDAILDLHWWAPTGSGSNFAIPWYLWFEKPAKQSATPEEPPQRVREQLDLVAKLWETFEESEQIEIMRQILDIAAEQFYGIGITLPGPGYGSVKSNMKNIFEPMPDAAYYPAPGPTNPEQYFFE